MDCIVLAGNRENYRQVETENKAFLDIDGRPILAIVLAELEKVSAVSRMVVVGPEDRLRSLLAETPLGKPVLIVPQRRDLVTNVQAALDVIEAERDPDRIVLILPSDIPCLIAEEVEQFIARCDMSRADYVCGLVPETAMQPYYPVADRPGIEMAYFHLAEGRFRISNLHMARPSAVHQLQLFRKTYAMRYQKNPLNMVRMFFVLLGLVARSPFAAIFYTGMQLATVLGKLGLRGASARVRRKLRTPFAERGISQMLKTRFKVASTDYGGSALDVDNNRDYHIIRQMFVGWVAHQKGLSP